jgi:phosphoglucosamine mutase
MDSEVKAAIEQGKAFLGKEGRVVVRVSGTEPLIRVMAEGLDKDKIETVTENIAEVVRQRLS